MWGLRDAEWLRACSSCRRPRFRSQPPNQAAHNHCNSRFSDSNTVYCPVVANRHARGIQTYMQALKHARKIKINKSLVILT